MNPAIPSHALRAALPLVALAAVAILAAPAHADPPPSTEGGDAGNPHVTAALANPPPQKPPPDSVTGRMVAGMRSLSDRDPWPDPPDIVIGPSPTGGEVPKAAEGPPPIVIEH
jgi:hypothetical protein